MAIKAQKKFIPEQEYATELLRYYAAMNKDGNEEQTCKNIWDYYVKRNTESIWKSESEIKIERFEKTSRLRSGEIIGDTVFDLFSDILFIETGLDKSNKKQYKKCMKMLEKQLKKNKISFYKPKKNKK